MRLFYHLLGNVETRNFPRCATWRSDTKSFQLHPDWSEHISQSGNFFPSSEIESKRFPRKKKNKLYKNPQVFQRIVCADRIFSRFLIVNLKTTKQNHQQQEYSVQLTFREQWLDERLKFDDIGGKKKTTTNWMIAQTKQFQLLLFVE